MNLRPPAIHPTAPRDASAEDKQCVFRIGRDWFSIPALAVKEITPASTIVEVPGSPEGLAGLCHVRSEFVPVLRLKALLQEGSANETDPQQLLVIEGHAGNWALLIDAVVSLIAMETLVHPDHRSDGSPSLILGTATCRDHIVRVLDPNGIFRHTSELLHQSWSRFAAPLQNSGSLIRSES